MLNRCTMRFLIVLIASLAASSIVSAAVPNRVAGKIDDGVRVSQAGSVSPRVKRAKDLGRLGGAVRLSELSINFLPSAAQQAALDALLVAQQDPRSPSYRKWLTPEEFGARFGMSDGDLAAVSAWLTARGLTVERIVASRNAIHFSGTVDRIEQAFQTELHTLSVDGEVHFANTTEPQLPAAFAGTVSGIRGLNDFRARPHVQRSTGWVPYSVNGRAVRASAARPVPLATDGAGDEYVAPEDFARIYNVTGMYSAGFNGSASYPIGIIGQSAIYSQDITDFRTAFGLSANLPTMVLVPNTGTSAVNSNGDLSESELDLEWSGAVAPNAPIYFVYTGNATTGTGNAAYFTYDVFNALQYSIQDYTVNGSPLPIISISYGECEPSDTAASYAMFESWFRQANAQGQTILSASGDLGAAGCDYTTTKPNSYAATSGLAVDYPSSSAYVTGVGGTTFTGDLANQSTYWAGTADAVFGNELGLYIPSGSWNDTPTTFGTISHAGISASGGGASALWAKPAWQTDVAGIPNDGKRDVPDVALGADPDHDAFLVCANLGCETNGSFARYGGTSVAAPSFAGMLALAEQKMGTTLGNVNPALYHIASEATGYASVFHDIITGSNIVPCVVAQTDPGCVGGLMGYNAGVGYDLATGLGAVDATNLAAALSPLTANIPTTTTVATSTSAPTTAQAVTFTATVTHGSGTAALSGNVVFTLDGAALGSGAINSAGTASYTTTITPAGTHTVTAAYAGDPNYYGSTASTTLMVTIPVSASNVPTTTTLAANSPTVALGGALSLTATVSASTSGALAGNVTFSTAGGSLGTVPVTVASGSSGTQATMGTAVLTLTVASATLPVGSDTVTATFGGGGTVSAGGSYLGSSGTAVETVTTPSLTLSGTNITMADGATGTSTITVTSAGGYAGTVNFTASTTSTVLSTYGGASFSPTSLVLAQASNGSTVLTISTGSTRVGASRLGGILQASGVWWLGGGLSFAGLALFGFAGRGRRLMPLLLSLVALATLGVAGGCGSSSVTTATSTLNIPKGTYTITVYAKDSGNNAIAGSTNVTLILN